MGLAARSVAHDGTTPAAAMVTPFSMPCGMNLLNEAYHMDPEARSKCAPPNFDQYWWSSVGYYSPALCPSGFVPGCFRWNSDQGPKVEVTETAVMCVPQGYNCLTNDISLAYSYSASAPMIQIRWAETDLPKFATHPLYPGANPTNTEVLGQGAMIRQRAAIFDRQASGSFGGTFFPSPTDEGGGGESPTRNGDDGSGSSPTDDGSTGFPQFTNYPGGDTNNDNGGGGGLSTGAKIGIGVGCGVFGLMLIGVSLFFLLWYRSRAKRAAAANAGSGYPYMGQGQGPPQYNPAGGAFVEAPPGRPEMHEDGKSELPGGFSTASPTVAGSESQGPTPVPAAYSPVDKDRKYTPSPAPVSEMSPELGTDRSFQGHPGGMGYQEVHGQSKSPYTELHSESRSAEAHGTPTSPFSELPTNEPQLSEVSASPRAHPAQVSSSSSPVQRKAVGQPPPLQSDLGPDHGVSILPGAGHTPASATFSPVEGHSAEGVPGGLGLGAEPTAQELDALREQHAQLERRRERLIELERIEKEQAELQQRMNRR